MYCTKCGALIFENENFCSKCGSAVKGRQGADIPQPRQQPKTEKRTVDADAPVVITITPEKAAEVMRSDSSAQNSGSQPNNKNKKKNKGAIVAISMLLVLIVAMVGIGVASNHLNATTPQEFIEAIANGDSESETDSQLNPENNDITTASSDTTTTTATTTTTTTTTTSKTTTTTTTTTTARTSSEQQLLAQQAREIAQLLVSKKWKTTVEGYDAVITFYKDGTALIEVDVKVGFFTVTQKVEATYEISSRCFAVIKGNYNGMELGISGTITKISNDELLVDRGGSLGTLTLKAVK